MVGNDGQNRQALGGAVNQLAGQNMEITRAAMDASRNVGQNLQNTLMRARLGADAQQMDTDEQLYAREQQGQEQQFQRALQAMEAFGISPDNPQYQQIMQQLMLDQSGQQVHHLQSLRRHQVQRIFSLSSIPALCRFL